MNGQQWAPMCAGFAVAVVLFLVLGYFLRKRDMTAHLAPVKRELKKEKQWLRRGEYNAAMVKGRQNLELFLKLVAEFNGIELDNSAQAMANAKSGPDGRGQRETYRMNGRKRQRVMTFQQFGWWLDENGYLPLSASFHLCHGRLLHARPMAPRLALFNRRSSLFPPVCVVVSDDPQNIFHIIVLIPGIFLRNIVLMNRLVSDHADLVQFPLSDPVQIPILVEPPSKLLETERTGG